MVVKKSESMMMHEEWINWVVSNKPKMHEQRGGIPVNILVVAVAAAIVLAVAIVSIV